MVYEQPESKIISTVSLPKWMCEFESLATCSPKHDFVLVIVVSGGMFLGRNGSVNGLINGETFFFNKSSCFTNVVIILSKIKHHILFTFTDGTFVSTRV